jgi:hypothetical protein
LVEGFRELERNVDPGIPLLESRREERPQTDLHTILQKLKLKDADDSMLELLKGGVDTIYRLANLYNWRLRKEEEDRKRRDPRFIERERKRRQKMLEREKRLREKYKDEERAEKRRRRRELLKKKREEAAKAKALKKELELEEKKRRAEERAQRIAEKKALAEQLRKEREQRKEEKRLMQVYWRPIRRSMDIS